MQRARGIGPMRLYFRINPDGAGVFRIAEDGPQRRLDLVRLGWLNVRSGELSLAKGAEISDEERAEVDQWLQARRAELAGEGAETARRLIADLNATTIWMGSAATDPEVAAIADRLLLAMHDLRDAIVRRRARDDD